MAYDEDLANRVREALSDGPTVREQRMFGGLSILVEGGNLAVAVSSRGGLLVRTGAEAAEEFIASSDAEEAVMGRRTMRGWVWVASEHLDSDEALATWVGRGIEHARSLPPKRR